MTRWWWATTPADASAALAIAEVRAGSAGAGAAADAHVDMAQGDADAAQAINALLRDLGLAPIAAGDVALRVIPGAEGVLIARPAPGALTLMPHAGLAVARGLHRALTAAGATHVDAPPSDPRAAYPEAGSFIEAAMLDALARARSPLALDLLLAQPARWRAALGREPEPDDALDEPDAPAACGGHLSRSARLRRLIAPPLVAAVGPTNIGKSTLLNALAGRAVAVVADEPGTTRDHVGAYLDLAGLVVRFIDTPGARSPDDQGSGPAAQPIPEPERAAAAMAMGVARGSDLLLLCSDARSPAPEALPALRELLAPGAPPVLRVGLRADLGPAPGTDLTVAAARGEGLGALAHAVRDALVHPADLTDPRPWRFWD